MYKHTHIHHTEKASLLCEFAYVLYDFSSLYKHHTEMARTEIEILSMVLVGDNSRQSPSRSETSSRDRSSLNRVE